MSSPRRLLWLPKCRLPPRIPQPLSFQWAQHWAFCGLPFPTRSNGKCPWGRGGSLFSGTYLEPLGRQGKVLRIDMRSLSDLVTLARAALLDSPFTSLPHSFSLSASSVCSPWETAPRSAYLPATSLPQTEAPPWPWTSTTATNALLPPWPLLYYPTQNSQSGRLNHNQIMNLTAWKPPI